MVKGNSKQTYLEYKRERDIATGVKKSPISRLTGERKLSQPKFIQQGTNITKEQDLLQGMFGGHNNQVIFSGNGDSLPKMNGMLREGQGLIKNNDLGRTGKLFGVRR